MTEEDIRAKIEERTRYYSLEETRLRELRNSLERIICITIFVVQMMVTLFLKSNCYLFVIFGIPLIFLLLILVYLAYKDYSGFKSGMLGKNND